MCTSSDDGGGCWRDEGVGGGGRADEDDGPGWVDAYGMDEWRAKKSKGWDHEKRHISHR